MTVVVVVYVLFLLFGVISGELILSDNDGHLVGLPLNGGTGTVFINGAVAQSINPYILSVFINDGTDGGIAGENETFYLDQPNAVGGVGQFGYGNLTNVYYSSSFSLTGGTNYGADLTKLGTPLSPLRAIGLYVFSFHVAVLKYIFANVTYVNAGPDPPAVTDVVTINLTNPAVVVGDPQFVGLRGQSFQIHGIDGAVYNLISEHSLQVNSRFVFLSQGECPLLHDKKDTNCWSHPGSYLGELSFQAFIDGKIHAIMLEAGSYKTGYDYISYNDRTLMVGDSITIGWLSLTIHSSHFVTIDTEHFSFQLSNSDMFINQAVSPKVPLPQLSAHGLLGQTHASRTYPTALRYIAGAVDDYVIGDDDIFGTDFVFNQFQV